MKINLDAIKGRIHKKIIMPIASLLIVALALFILIGTLKSCIRSKHSNMIDLDMLEPDGTVNQKKIFQELIKEDIEKNMRYKRKGAF